jgi:PAS domain S-box-containing protein
MLSVLVIDDEQDILELVQQFLQRFGDMQVETTRSTKEALGIVTKNEYDAIVLDCFMPELTGIDFLKILRAKGDTTPIIIFTGVGRENSVIEAINYGADFFLKKGDDPKTQFRELAHMIRQAIDRRSVGRSMGTSQRVISDVISFSNEAMFAIDREGRVAAWNGPMEELSGVAADAMVGREDHEYATPFFGKKVPMLIDLVLAPDTELAEHGYTTISREKGAVIAWIKTTKQDGTERIFWMRAKPLYDGKGGFIGAAGSVRDITGLARATLKRVPDEPVRIPAPGTASEEKVPVQTGMFDRITGKAKSLYKQGVRLYYREGKYQDALVLFDRAIGIDPDLAYIWNDRGLCFMELGKFDEAQKCFERAVELIPRDEEFLYDKGEVLELIGIMRRDNKILEQAVLTFALVTEINPSNANAWNHLGVCIKETGKDEESRQSFELARRLTQAKKDRMFRRKRESVS